MKRIRIWINLALVLLVAFALRRWGLAAESPGLEEIMGLSLAHGGLRAHLHSQFPDFAPPAYLIFLSLMTSIGGKLWAARFLSLLAGVAAPALLYLMGRRRLPSHAAGIAALMLAVNALHIFFSQEAQPTALFNLMTVAGLILLIRSAENNKLRDWLLYNAVAVAMVQTHRNGIFVVAAFALVHFIKPFLPPEPHVVGSVRPGRAVARAAINYGIILAISLPWLVISMPVDPPYLVTSVTALDFLAVFNRNFWFGVSTLIPFHLVFLAGAFYVLLLPPIIRAVRSMEFRIIAPLIAFIAALLLMFGVNHIPSERPISAAEAASITTPLFAVSVGILLALCNLYVRLSLVALALALALTGTVRQRQNEDKVPWNKLAVEVRRVADPKDLIVFWPDFTTTLGHYFLNEDYQIASAGELFEKWAGQPENPNVFFVLTQYPMEGYHANTFPGALSQYARTQKVWGDRMNQILQANTLDMATLRQWYQEPKSLNIIDAHTSATQFIFTPADAAFKDEKQFHYKRPDLNYDYEDGRRAVWTAKKDVELILPVTLAPGSYVLKVHCAPDYYQASTGVEHDREVTVEIRTGEERRTATITAETTLQRSFTTETEMKTLKVHITASPMLKLGRPENAQLGLKIYSISIDSLEGDNAF
ncbi:hypothetical protein CVU37_11625 [candidate division BRC1 bacterium HGW-BRC1-1]|jgi:hypothetical protein|nr:MAG: hypothetical protein CVU37_11625 [candidate division BRC1 bacterium HGW-BRC1-1]